LQDALGAALSIEHRAFPLRPTPVPAVAFKGTYREEGWRRCGQMAAADGITFTPWPHAQMPNWSLPALEAAKCVARQGDALFDRVNLALFEAFFTHSRNIADPAAVRQVVAGVGADLTRFDADLESGAGREAVVKDYEAAVAEGVRSIPTVIVPETGRALVGLVDATMYRAAVEEATA
jgi:predicted DsbA family dithiol-disulfide isomerase